MTEEQDVPEVETVEIEVPESTIKSTLRGAGLIALIVAVGYIAVWGQKQIVTSAVPEPYHSQIVKLRDENVSLDKQCNELNRKVAELQIQRNWNVNQINIISGEAITAQGLNQQSNRVNVQTLRIEHTP